MSTTRPVVRRQDGKDAESWEGLTEGRKRLVKWMVDNDKDHRDAIVAGIITNTSVYRWYGVDNIYKWCEWYRETLPKPPPDPVALIEAALPTLTERALELMRETLEAGEGNATAVRAAQWTLEKAYEFAKAQPKTDATKAAMSELEAVLRVVS